MLRVMMAGQAEAAPERSPLRRDFGGRAPQNGLRHLRDES